MPEKDIMITKSKLWICVMTVTGLFMMVFMNLPCRACYSGLALIPTAETVGSNQYSVTLQTDGTFDKLKADTYIVNTQFGIGDRFEAGLDYDASAGIDTRLFWNAKYILTNFNKDAAAFAIGYTGIAKNQKSAPYITLTNDFKAIRGHIGFIKSDDKYRLFIGADKELSDKFCLMADYTYGDENLSSVALNYQMNDTISCLVGAQFPNEGGDSLFTFQIAFGGSYKK